MKVVAGAGLALTGVGLLIAGFFGMPLLWLFGGASLVGGLILLAVGGNSGA